jgi:hypothetical protein
MRTKLHRSGRTRRRRTSDETSETCRCPFAVVVATVRDTTENLDCVHREAAYKLGLVFEKGGHQGIGEKPVVANEQRAFCF